ncbi:hypothetical protein RN001_000712 [Aquatica leii]|uniref:Luciferin 4-monooxygenase n=1 Tax=Aquatica leii TaxID=1421715 RepID=A0AAN7PKH1_9COLE|nr:hypothetical protein RN001_000712 [Aquatica leii]
MIEEHIVYGPKPVIPISKDSLGIIFYNHFKKNPDDVALIDAFTRQTVTNKELLETTIKLADSIQNYGLKQNDVIGIFSENNVMFFHPLLASLYLGVIVTMFNPQYTVDEFLHVLNISQPKILFCSTSSKATIRKTIKQMKVAPKIVIIDAEIADSDCDSLSSFIANNSDNQFKLNQFLPKQINTDEQVAFVLYSSGTTGLPKGVMITHTNVNTAFILSTNVKSNLNEHILGLMPFYHSYGFNIIFSKIFTNQKIVVFKKFDPEVYLDSIQQYKIKYLHVVPSIAHFLATSPLVSKYDLSSVNKILCGGAPLSYNVQDLLRKKFNLHLIRQAYGLTETTISVICPQDSTTRFGSSGKVRPFMEVKIVDTNTSQTLAPMQKGELYCRGPQVMKGYMNDPGSTSNAIDKDGWFRTGDIAYYDDDGYFYIVDRLKELIKYKGFQVPPAELESVLLKHSKIIDAAVIGIPDERVGELPFAFVVKNGSLSEKEVQDFVAKELSPEKHLRGGVQFVESIPRNLSGKILKRILRENLNKPKSKL